MIIEARIDFADHLAETQDDAALHAWEEATRLSENPSTYLAWRNVAAARVRAQDLRGAFDAYREAEKIKGEGDATSARIYAQAFSKNPEFYSFYRSMEAYRNSFRNKSDVMVLEPSSDFFKYLKNPNKGGK